jgi:hypothetical protein
MAQKGLMMIIPMRVIIPSTKLTAVTQLNFSCQNVDIHNSGPVSGRVNCCWPLPSFVRCFYVFLG